MNNMQLSIIIVNYNTKSLLRNCLTSVYALTSDITFEVIVSDNGSTDGSIEMLKSEFPQVILIENNANLGFGAANNRALDIAKGKYIFYLNSDTVLLNNACKIFYDYWESAQNKDSIGAIGANLLDKDNNVIHSYGQFAGYSLSIKQLAKMMVTNFILSIFYIFHISPNRFAHSDKTDFYLGPVDYITGADLFLLNSPSARFDENFFLYFEEADLQRQLELNGKERFIIDGPKIQHLCGGSVGSDFSIKRKTSYGRIQFEISRVKFLKKYSESKIKLFIVKLLISICWINPFLIGKTKKYFKTIWNI